MRLLLIALCMVFITMAVYAVIFVERRVAEVTAITPSHSNASAVETTTTANALRTSATVQSITTTTWSRFSNGYFSFSYPPSWSLGADGAAYYFENGVSAPLIIFWDANLTDQEEEGYLTFDFKNEVPDPNSAMPNYVTVDTLAIFEALQEERDNNLFAIVNKKKVDLDGYAGIEYDLQDPTSRALEGEVLCIETKTYFITAWLNPVFRLSWSGDTQATAHAVINSLMLSKRL